MDNLVKDITKTCGSCGDKKPLMAFWRNNRRSGVSSHGRYNRCIECLERLRPVYDILPDSNLQIINGKRECGKCSKQKSLIDFPCNKHGKLGRSTICKSCRNDWKVAWKKSKGLPTRKPLSEREASRDQQRRYKFGLTASAFKDMFDAQNGKCGICEKYMDFLARSTCIDHDHNSGLIRGILCGKCNLGLGHFNDDIENMKKAISYLEKHSHEQIFETKLEIVKG